MTRREAVGGVLALPAVCLAQPSVRPHGSPPRPVARCVVDGRFASARAVAGHFLSLGGQVLELPRDALQCWDQLGAGEDAGGAFAGVTTERSLFLLQTLAAGQRMRLALRVHAENDGSGQVHHWALAPQSTLGQCAAVLQGADLHAGMAQLLRHWHSGPLISAPPMRVSSGAVAGAAGMVAWIIAPASAHPIAEGTWT